MKVILGEEGEGGCIQGCFCPGPSPRHAQASRGGGFLGPQGLVAPPQGPLLRVEAEAAVVAEAAAVSESAKEEEGGEEGGSKGRRIGKSLLPVLLQPTPKILQTPHLYEGA